MNLCWCVSSNLKQFWKFWLFLDHNSKNKQNFKKYSGQLLISRGFISFKHRNNSATFSTTYFFLRKIIKHYYRINQFFTMLSLKNLNRIKFLVIFVCHIIDLWLLWNPVVQIFKNLEKLRGEATKKVLIDSACVVAYIRGGA